MPRQRSPEPIITDADYVAALERDNDELRTRVAMLEAKLGRFSSSDEVMLTAPSARFGLSRTEGHIFARIAAAGYATRDDLMTIANEGGSKNLDPKILHVWINKIRNKLAPFGIVIETARGRGYKIDAEGMAKIAAIQSGTEPEHAS
jgi:hypothetical protein